MPKYEYKTSYAQKTKRPKIIRSMILLVLIVFAALAGWALIEWLMQRGGSGKQSQQTTLSYQAEPTNRFSTEYFEFSAESKWREMSGESRPDRYVYRSFSGNLAEEELVIEINEPAGKSLAEQTSDRVLAVKVMPDGTLSAATEVSGHCKEVYPESSFAQPKEVQMSGTKFLCNPNSSQYHVMVAELGGNERLAIPRPNQAKAAYYIEYKNNKFEPSSNSLFQILKSFKAR